MSQPLPHSPEAERAVIGSLFVAPRFMGAVSEMLGPRDFMMPAHAEIFEALQAVEARDARVDVVMVAEELKNRGSLEKLPEGPLYLMLLANEVPTAENAMAYARIVKEKANLRALIAACAQVSAAAHGDIGDAGEFMVDADATLSKVLRLSAGGGPETLAELVPLAQAEFERRAATQGQTIGIPTGFMKLDYLLSGFQKQRVYTLAAETSLGKSSLAAQWALGAARRGYAALIITLEASGLQMVERCFSHAGPIDNARLRTGTLDYGDWKHRLIPAGAALSALPVTISGAHTIAAIERKARAVKTGNPDRGLMVVLDYIQLARAPEVRGGRELEVAEVSRRLKRLATALDCPVLSVAQLNRATEEGRPKLKNLRESGAIEQDSDVVMFIVRGRASRDAVIEVAKNRDGSLGECNVEFDGSTYTFREPTGSSFSEAAEPSEA